MCDFLSGGIGIVKGVNEGMLYFKNLQSHSGIEGYNNIKPNTYREFEWTGEDEDTLSIRVMYDEDEVYFKALILGIYPTRSEMIKDLCNEKLKCKMYSVLGALKNVQDVKELVEKHKIDITADDNYAVGLASKNGHLEVVKYLVSKGAKLK